MAGTGPQLILSDADLEQIRSLGKTEDEVRGEYRLLQRPVPAMRLVRPCRVGDGIVRLSSVETDRMAALYREHAARGRATKFVAASGAASRMFRAHLACLDRPRPVTRDTLEREAAAGSTDATEILQFLDSLPRFAFHEELCEILRRRGTSFEELNRQGACSEILAAILRPDGLGYGDAPKGLIRWHLYPDGPRSAFEEHLVEGAGHVRDSNGTTHLHFTVAPGAEARVREHLRAAAERFATGGTRFEVGVSTQARRTEAIALDADGQPVRDPDGRLVFWPSGHGALLDNLDELKGDIVFVRTVDNALPDRLKPLVNYWKEVLGGVLVAFQERMQDRPLRVCAMVRHEKHPGGHPFRVSDWGGQESMQIVDAAQVDMSDPEQKRIWEAAEYFNPADLVCGMRDGNGVPFELAQYRDDRAYFAAVKSYRGRRIRVLERPGLWNGAMARWNTVFVEVPAETLHPVKNILELLDPVHLHQVSVVEN